MNVQRHKARIGARQLEGDLIVPEAARCAVVFAHGSWASRPSPRNTLVADALRARDFGTLLFDLPTEAEVGLGL